MTDVRFVAIGDSFTEGVGDERADGTPRGWADLVAQGWATSLGTPISYANFAIRGKLAWPVVDEQLEAALALGPTHLSFNGGGNDMLRPQTDFEHIVDAFARVLRRCDEEGVTMILLSGANPTGGLPMKKLISTRGDQLSDAVIARFTGRDDVVRALNWPDRELAGPDYWAEDRLHMNYRGHHRVAARVLSALGQQVPDGWWSLPPTGAKPLSNAAFAKAHLGPWFKRRLTGTSSGDGRRAKFADWTEIAPKTEG